MKKILGIIKISRPVNFIITFLVVLTSAFICSEEIFELNKIIFTSLSASFIAGAGNIINDIFDYRIDLINRPSRPLPKKELSINFAAVLYLIFNSIGLYLAFLASWNLFFIALLICLILLIYSYSLKNILIVGNFTVAFCTASAFVYGGIAVNNWEASIIPAVFAFLVNFIREIVKDVEDQEGDLINNVITFPSKFGIKSTKKLLIFLIIVLILLTFYPFLNSIYKIEYFILVLFSVDLLLAYIIKLILYFDFTKEISKISKLLKLSMLFGLIAIMAG